MKINFSKLSNKIQNHPLIVFIALLDLFINIILRAYELFLGKIKLNQINMEASYFEIAIRLLTVVFLYFLWKSFLKTKNSVEKNLNNLNEHWFQQTENSTKHLNNNINDSHRILSNKI